VVEIVVAASSSSGISWVKYHAFAGSWYSSGWVSMEYGPERGRWVGWWDTTGLPEGNYQIMARARSGQGMFGYDLMWVYKYA